MKHRILVLTAVLLVGLLLSVAMAEDMGLSILAATQNTETHGLQISIANALPDADKLENYKVTLGGNSLTLTGITEGAEAAASDTAGAGTATVTNEIGTSWLFLVDISTVSTDSATSYPLTATLEALIDMVGSKDNAALVTTAMPTPEDMISGRTTLKNQVKAAGKFDKNANRLYDAVLQSLDFLETSDKAKPNKSLVVISKGDNKNGIASLTDVLDKIQASNVTVYTIAYIDGGASRDFGSMAQESIKSGHGGSEINKDTVGSGKIQEAAASIIQRAERDRKRDAGEGGGATPASSTVYTITTEQPREGVDKTVVVFFTGGDLNANAAFVIDGDIVYPKKSFFDWLFTGLKEGNITCVAIVAGVAVLLVLIVVLLIKLLGKKGDKVMDYNAGEVVAPPVNETSVTQTTTITSGVNEPNERKRLQLTLREATGKTHRAMLTQEGVTAGRQGDNHIVLDSNDKHISRHHFMLKQNGEEVILESVSETNGTYVNGMRVEGPIALRQKDVIRVGGSEMTVTWKYV